MQATRIISVVFEDIFSVSNRTEKITDIQIEVIGQLYNFEKD
jgi:hypothetical protein